VFTFKEGLLAAAGHDLRLRVTRFSVEIDEEAPRVAATFDAASLRVDGHVVDGRLVSEGGPSVAERREIEERAAREVLRTQHWPEVRFTSTSVERTGKGALRVVGRLALCGQERELAATVREEPGRYVAEVRLDQRDFGIRPFSAMLGALRIKPHVLVRLTVPRG
jgi:polyisoprenoid-binding protein YceI